MQAITPVARNAVSCFILLLVMSWIDIYYQSRYSDTTKDTVGDTMIFENNYLETLTNYLETINVLT